MRLQNAELVQDWAVRINMALRSLSQRPSTLLVVVNPFGGARKARKVWRRVANPIFESAGAAFAGLTDLSCLSFAEVEVAES